MISLVVRRWQLAIVLYVFTVIGLLWSKPSLMFRPDGSAKNWGSRIDEDVSVFAPSFMFPLLAVLIYMLATTVEMTTT